MNKLGIIGGILISAVLLLSNTEAVLADSSEATTPEATAQSEQQYQGLFGTVNVDSDIEGGINRVAQYLKQDKIRVFSTLENFLWERERYHWAEQTIGRTGESKAVPYKEHDHLMDCWKMLIASRPIEAEKIKKEPNYTKPIPLTAKD